MRRSGSRKVKVSFTAGQLTHFGGVYLLHQFLQQLKFRTFLGRRLQCDERNNHFTISERLCALLYPMILGLHQSLELTALLGTNGVFQYLTGLPKFPHPDTLRQFLSHKATTLHPRLRTVHDDLRTHFLVAPRPRSTCWLDFDSTVRSLYGNQEGVVRGYNPGHRGERSYHPLLCTEAHGGDCLGGELRYGNASVAAGVVAMLDGILALVPPEVRAIRTRADAGFYDKKFIARLSQNRIGFAVVAHCTPRLKCKLPGLRYTRMNNAVATAEFRYQPRRWPQPYRFVVLREKLTERRQEQLRLFTVDAFAYHVIVTNLALTPYGVFAFYLDRAGLERIVRILKDDYPFAKAPTHSFPANAMYAELSLLAYNLIVWFRRLCLPDDWQTYTVGTLRQRLLLVPGNFTRTGNRPELKLPKNNPYQDTFRSAMQRLRMLRSLV